MAQLIGLQVYQINSMDPIPVASTPVIGFPFAGILVRAIQNGLQLSNGIVVYSQVQTLANGSIYLVRETEATIVAAS